MKKLLSFVLLLASMHLMAGNNPYSIYTANLPFAMPEVYAPSFPNHLVVLSDFGARNDGTSLCTVPRPPSFEPRGPGGGAMVSVGGATFMVGDSGYMTL